MVGYLLLFAFVFPHLALCQQQRTTISYKHPLYKEPLTVTISPKIWNLLDLRAELITKYLKTIELPEQAQNDTMLDYKVSNIALNDISIPKSGVSFEDMNNGVHLRMRNIKFRAVATIEVAVGVSVFKAGLKGDVKVNCDNAELDLVLNVGDYKITPVIKMKAGLQFEFTESLRAANLFESKIREYAEYFVSNSVPDMIAKTCEKEVNPLLQKLKRLVAGVGLSEFGVEWTVQNNTLRVGVKPKSAMGKIAPIKPMSKMVCIDSNLLAALREMKRSKREAVNSDSKKSKLGIYFTCSPPEGDCTESSCSYCADLDIFPTTTSTGVGAELGSCVPKNL
ncbi:hypothetical protein Y032_0004g2216 [Ancylostoma ceylanicum]|uniref:Lipid-binding serum glycoprotein N-terminal domain-containing protein n=1 Tax=Ancylostoma ceylanicum TaxID=53326 RepID=A0A016VX51_9BILA|nr:hypothetical protein Y032_0004g2216 [Ancylostoma ceylanicum]